MQRDKTIIQSNEAKETGRIEAFSDGVFAIAITLLVLDIKVPPHETTSDLLSALGAQWPHYLAYLTSFLMILIMWSNHHMMFRPIKRTDHVLLLLNGLLLMFVTLVPFPTSLVAEYLITGNANSNGTVATLVFGGLFFALAITFNLIWLYVSRNPTLLNPDINRNSVGDFTRRYRLGPLFYLLGFALAFWQPVASVVVYLVLAIFYAIPYQRYGQQAETQKAG